MNALAPRERLVTLRFCCAPDFSALHPSLCTIPQGIVVFKIDDAEWTLDLRPEATGERLYEGPPKEDKADITLTVTDANFAQLVMGKLNPQQVRGSARRIVERNSGPRVSCLPVCPG